MVRRGFGALGGALALMLQAAPASADETPAWMMPELLAAAKTEGQITVYGSTNEQEALPLWKIYEDATGVRVNYIRGAEGPLLSRVATEMRAGQPTWDIMQSSAVSHMPASFTLAFDPPEARNLFPEARDPQRRWYGVYAAYNAPQYNTSLVAREDLPASYEDFATRKKWAGRVAIDGGDREWLMSMLAHFGAERGRTLVERLARDLSPVVLDGHLAMARAIAAGEYLISLTNYTMLASNMRLTGAPTDFWPLDPVSMFISQVGVNARAPHPNAARLAANFIIGREAQQFAAKTGRLPTRDDVEPTPADAVRRLRAKKIVPVLMDGEQSRAAQKLFDTIFKGR